MAAARWLKKLGHPWRVVQQVLGISARTIRHWLRGWRRRQLPARRRGRPPKRSAQRRRQQLLATIEEAGAHVGAAPLAALHRDMPRREVASILARVREVHRKRGRTVYRLEWRPGHAWAMDHAEAPGEILKDSRAILATRDLGSYQGLLWDAVENVGGEATSKRLAQLLEENPAPLVVKIDNGSGLCAEIVCELLEKHGVLVLRSPPRTPSYNGAIEASIGSQKKRTEHRAMLEGHPGEWTRANLNWAREQANETARPRGPNGPTPREMWNSVTPISDSERSALARSVKEKYEALLRESGSLPKGEPSKTMRMRCQRKAIVNALIECGTLKVRRRVIHPRIVTKRSAIIP